MPIFRRLFGLAALMGTMSPTVALSAPPRLQHSQPEAETIIRGRHTAFVVRFDVAVDHAASRLQILRDGKVIENLEPRLETAPEVLYAGTETPPPGHYELYWSARGTNGEVSEGAVPFSTAP